MARARIYVDSDVLIWHLRGKSAATECLRQLDSEADSELWTGAMQRAEILFFMRDNERQATLLLLSRLRTDPVSEAVVDQAGEWFRRYHPSVVY